MSIFKEQGHHRRRRHEHDAHQRRQQNMTSLSHARRNDMISSGGSRAGGSRRHHHEQPTDFHQHHHHHHSLSRHYPSVLAPAAGSSSGEYAHVPPGGGILPPSSYLPPAPSSSSSSPVEYPVRTAGWSAPTVPSSSYHLLTASGIPTTTTGLTGGEDGNSRNYQHNVLSSSSSHPTGAVQPPRLQLPHTATTAPHHQHQASALRQPLPHQQPDARIDPHQRQLLLQRQPYGSNVVLAASSASAGLVTSRMSNGTSTGAGVLNRFSRGGGGGGGNPTLQRSAPPPPVKSYGGAPPSSSLTSRQVMADNSWTPTGLPGGLVGVAPNNTTGPASGNQKDPAGGPTRPLLLGGVGSVQEQQRENNIRGARPPTAGQSNYSIYPSHTSPSAELFSFVNSNHHHHQHQQQHREVGGIPPILASAANRSSSTRHAFPNNVNSSYDLNGTDLAMVPHGSRLSGGGQLLDTNASLTTTRRHRPPSTTTSMSMAMPVDRQQQRQAGRGELQMSQPAADFMSWKGGRGATVQGTKQQIAAHFQKHHSSLSSSMSFLPPAGAGSSGVLGPSEEQIRQHDQELQQQRQHLQQPPMTLIAGGLVPLQPIAAIGSNQKVLDFDTFDTHAPTAAISERERKRQRKQIRKQLREQQRQQAHAAQFEDWALRLPNVTRCDVPPTSSSPRLPSLTAGIHTPGIYAAGTHADVGDALAAGASRRQQTFPEVFSASGRSSSVVRGEITSRSSAAIPSAAPQLPTSGAAAAALAAGSPMTAAQKQQLLHQQQLLLHRQDLRHQQQSSQLVDRASSSQAPATHRTLPSATAAPQPSSLSSNASRRISRVATEGPYTRATNTAAGIFDHSDARGDGRISRSGIKEGSSPSRAVSLGAAPRPPGTFSGADLMAAVTGGNIPALVEAGKQQSHQVAAAAGSSDLPAACGGDPAGSKDEGGGNFDLGRMSGADLELMRSAMSTSGGPLPTRAELEEQLGVSAGNVDLQSLSPVNLQAVANTQVVSLEHIQAANQKNLLLARNAHVPAMLQRNLGKPVSLVDPEATRRTLTNLNPGMDPDVLMNAILSSYTPGVVNNPAAVLAGGGAEGGGGGHGAVGPNEGFVGGQLDHATLIQKLQCMLNGATRTLTPEQVQYEEEQAQRRHIFAAQDAAENQGRKIQEQQQVTAARGVAPHSSGQSGVLPGADESLFVGSNGGNQPHLASPPPHLSEGDAGRRSADASADTTERHGHGGVVPSSSSSASTTSKAPTPGTKGSKLSTKVAIENCTGGNKQQRPLAQPDVGVATYAAAGDPAAAATTSLTTTTTKKKLKLASGKASQSSASRNQILASTATDANSSYPSQLLLQHQEQQRKINHQGNDIVNMLPRKLQSSTSAGPLAAGPGQPTAATPPTASVGVPVEETADPTNVGASKKMHPELASQPGENTCSIPPGTNIEALSAEEAQQLINTEMASQITRLADVRKARRAERVKAVTESGHAIYDELVAAVASGAAGSLPSPSFSVEEELECRLKKEANSLPPLPTDRELFDAAIIAAMTNLQAAGFSPERLSGASVQVPTSVLEAVGVSAGLTGATQKTAKVANGTTAGVAAVDVGNGGCLSTPTVANADSESGRIGEGGGEDVAERKVTWDKKFVEVTHKHVWSLAIDVETRSGEIDTRQVDVVQIYPDPLVLVLYDLLTSDECDLLLELAATRWQAWQLPTVVDGNAIEEKQQQDGDGAANGLRESESVHFARIPRNSTNAVERLMHRVACAFQEPICHLESFALIRYSPGVSVEGQHDGNQRCKTLLLYLNDIEEGGETDFPVLGFQIKPRKGTAVMWNNVQADGSNDPRVVQSSLASNSMPKYLLACFINVENVEELERDLEEQQRIAELHWQQQQQVIRKEDTHR